MGKFVSQMIDFLSGFNIKKGNSISSVPWAMGRMKSVWGEDAEDFRPEIWLDENGVFRQESPYKFTVFQAGPRICLGKEFSYRQMKVFSVFSDEKSPLDLIVDSCLEVLHMLLQKLQLTQWQR